MRVLHYNWAPLSPESNQGGGVTVYLRNLLSEMADLSSMEVCFLNGGVAYNSLWPFPYVRKTRACCAGCHAYEIVNSPILAPSSSLSGCPKVFTDDRKSHTILRDFIRRHGPFDVVHFHDFEGLSLAALQIKREWPQTRIVFTAHNYVSVCPIGLLFRFDEERRCTDYEQGRGCVQCAARFGRQSFATRFHKRIRLRLPKSLENRLWLLTRLMAVTAVFLPSFWRCRRKNPNPGDFVRYRAKYVKEINESVDVVLTVSNRTRQILVDRGFDPSKTFVSYIGTRVADGELARAAYPIRDKLTIAYLGYANAYKGYDFFLEALSAMSSEMKARIRVVLAAKGAVPDYIRDKLRGYDDIRLYDGFSHDELGRILEGVNLGVVPVLWEDNLPQVAIEMVAKGVPVLCSDLGGASELCPDPAFVFAAGDVDDFRKRLLAFVKTPGLLDTYWQKRRKLVTMHEHVAELLGYYGVEKR